MSKAIASDFCKLGLAVIETEAAAVQDLTQRIDQSFAYACELLLACQGRVIVMGIGKSGHIANKIAATLASTGTPSFFVHPAEASHGDMGMITLNDTIIAISNSGEASELTNILPLIKRLDIPLISLSGKPESTLATHATVNLNVGVKSEACPLGLAPTSSTTAALVMGDALAIALLNARGFTADDFAKSHPGGQLGRRTLLRVETLMHTGDTIPMVGENATLGETLLIMSQKSLGMACVCDANQKLIGVFTDGDLRRVLDNQHDIHTTVIKQVMSVRPKSIQAALLAVEALNIMESHKITSLIVCNDDQQVIGVIHMHDMLIAGVA